MSLRNGLRFLRDEFYNLSLIVFGFRLDGSFVILVIFKIIYGQILLSLLPLGSLDVVNPPVFLLRFGLLYYQDVANFSRVCIGRNYRNGLIRVSGIYHHLVASVGRYLTLKFF